MTHLQLPDNLVKRIRDTAETIGVSIPDFLTQLISDYSLNVSHAAGSKKPVKRSSITARLNALYGQEPSSLDLALHKMQSLSLGREQW